MAEFDPSVIEKPKLEASLRKRSPKPSRRQSRNRSPARRKRSRRKTTRPPRPRPKHERIEKENKSKQEEYDKKIKDGKQKTDDLNARFGDWYYIIGNDVYQKIHLGRKDVIQKKEKKEEAKKDDGHDHAAEQPKADSPSEFKDLAKTVPEAAPGKPAPKAETPAKPTNPGDKQPVTPKPAGAKSAGTKPTEAKPAGTKPVTPTEKAAPADKK